MSAAETAETFTAQEWRYAGLRIGASGKLVQTWLDAAGELRAFSWKRSEGSKVIGATYTLEANADAARIGTARYVGSVEDDLRTTWVAEDRAAQARAELDAAERAAKRTETDALGAMTLDEARAFVNAGPFTTRTARLAVVLKHLGA